MCDPAGARSVRRENETHLDRKLTDTSYRFDVSANGPDHHYGEPSARFSGSHAVGQAS